MLVYMRYTDAKGNTHVSEHSVWDHDLFVTTRYADHKKAGGSAVEITQKEYREARWGQSV